MSKLKPASLAVIALLAVALFLLFQAPEPPSESEISYTQFLARESEIRSVVIRGDRVSGRDADGRRFAVQVPSSATTAERLAQRGVDVSLSPASAPAGKAELLGYLVYYAALVTLLWYLHRIARALERGRPRDPAS